MTKKLDKEDIKLLKNYFYRKVHESIEEHKDSPVEVLELFNKQPITILDFLNPYFLVGITVFLTTYFSIITNESLIQSLGVEGFIATEASLLGAIIIIAYIFAKNIRERKEEWLAFEFMKILLKNEGEKAENLRRFLKNWVQTKETD